MPPRRKSSLLGLHADQPAVNYNPDSMDEDAPLPPLSDDSMDDMIGSLNDPRRENLSQYEPSPVTGGMSSGSGGYYGGDEGQVIGRPVTPKIWANAQLHPSVVQLRVWKKTNGVPVLIGTIDAHATEEEFIRTFFDVMPAPGEGQGVFVVRPVDREGREIREEVTLPPISEYHTILKAMRISRAAAASAGIAMSPYPYAPASMPPELLKLVERAQEAADSRTRIMEEELRSARDLAMRAQEQAAQERIDLASRTAMSVEAITERMMKQESERTQKTLDAEKLRADQQQTALTSMFTQMQVMMQQAQEREREAFDRRLREDEARREREQREYDRRMTDSQRESDAKREREREEWERKSRVEKDEAERRERERESERARQHDLRMREMETSAQRDREHAERMIELTKMREKGESIEGTIEKTTKVLGMLGVNPMDLIGKVMGKKDDDDEESGGSTVAGVMAAIAPLLGEGAKVFGEVMKANAQARGQQARMMGPGPMGMPAGYPPQGYYPQQPMLPAPPQQPLAAAEMGSYAPAPQYTEYTAQAPMQPPMQPAPAAPAAPAGPQSSLPLAGQRTARNALRNLVKTLRSTPREGWEDAITFAIASELSIYQYVNDVSVRYALGEAGADEPFTAQVIESLRASDKVPNDLSYGDGR